MKITVKPVYIRCATILRHERMCLILLAVVTFACLAMNKLDVLIFHKKTFSAVTFIFFPLCLFSTCFNAEIIGYIIGAILIEAAYIVLVLTYRRKKYIHWKHPSEK